MDASVAAPTGLNVTDYDYSSFNYAASDDPFAILEPYNEWYARAIPQGYYLFQQAMSTPPGGHIALTEGLHQRRVELVNLSSYNYLGLSSRPEVVAAAKEALDRYGLGAAGSPILSGTMDVHVRLEEALARFKRKEAAMVFPTGYSTNVGVISALMRPGDWVIADQNAHASIVDGAILSKATVRFFRHNNAADLEKKLKQATGKKLVAIEGVYSMDGDTPPLADLVGVAKKYGARVLLDEAHSAFVYGPDGRGLAAEYGLDDQIDVHIGTFSKALGGQGGYVACSRGLYNYLKGFAARACSRARSRPWWRRACSGRWSWRRPSPSCATGCGPTSGTSAPASRRRGWTWATRRRRSSRSWSGTTGACSRSATACSARASTCSRCSTRPSPSTARASACRSRRRTPSTSSTRA
jgi:7-keto-8-aminopelargonate synthetase-like enzyme